MTRLEQLVQESQRLAPRSRVIYSAAVRSFVTFAGTDERRWAPGLVKAWFDGLCGEMRPQSANVQLRGLRFAFKRFAAMRYGEDVAAAVEYRAPGARGRKPQALQAEQVVKLLDTCSIEGTLSERRDRVILCLGLLEGLRREEMVRLNWQQPQPEDAPTVLKDVLRKGGGIVDHPIDVQTAVALGALRNALGSERTLPGHPILQGARPRLDGTLSARLSANGVYEIVKARAKQAGLRVVPHELRHTCGSLALEAGVPTWRVAKHLNHASEATTIRTYAHDLKAEGGESVGHAITSLLRKGKDRG